MLCGDSCLPRLARRGRSPHIEYTTCPVVTQVAHWLMHQLPVVDTCSNQLDTICACWIHNLPIGKGMTTTPRSCASAPSMHTAWSCRAVLCTVQQNVYICAVYVRKFAVCLISSTTIFYSLPETIDNSSASRGAPNMNA